MCWTHGSGSVTQIIKPSQAYTESDLNFRSFIYSGFRFSFACFVRPSKQNYLSLFTAYGPSCTKTLCNPFPPLRGVWRSVQGQLCNLGQDSREKSCEKSRPGWACAWSHLLFPPWLAFLAWIWPHLFALALPSHGYAAADPSCHHQGCSAQLAGLLRDCTPADTELALREPNMWQLPFS